MSWRAEAGVICNLEKKRPRRVAIDEADSTSGDLVREVSRNFDGCCVLVEIRFTVTTAMSVVIDRAAHKPEEFVEAMRIWTEFRFRTKMPFADQARGVAVPL